MKFLCFRNNLLDHARERVYVFFTPLVFLIVVGCAGSEIDSGTVTPGKTAATTVSAIGQVPPTKIPIATAAVTNGIDPVATSGSTAIASTLLPQTQPTVGVAIPTSSVPTVVSPTPTPVPPPTATPFWTAIPATPTATPTPVPTEAPTAGSMSARYGVISHTGSTAVISNMLQTLGANEYIDFQSNPATAPAGTTKLIYIPVRANIPVLSTSQIQTYADAKPGSIWYVGGETNLWSSVDQVVEDMKYYYDQIRAADPTAKITSPSMLNWTFTCFGCAGYTTGQHWLSEFVDRYQQLYSEPPPWDYWAIDLYPIDWWNTPNNGFSPEVIAEYAGSNPPAEKSLPVEQLLGLREFIDSKQEFTGAPIIVTELGIHWGYDAVTITPECPSGKPTGNYNLSVMIDYFSMVFDWLDANASSKHIEKWFTYTTYRNIGQCRSDGYAGVSIFDDPNDGVTLSEFGEWYRVRSSP